MDLFLSEHGGVIVSGIVSIVSIVLIFMVIIAVSNMEAYGLSEIIGG
ncbi:hypothetical protein [uncultured Eubacterium sp.]|nr:hypothetical protein [uncultured Eubacterium sp.]